MEVEKIELQ